MASSAGNARENPFDYGLHTYANWTWMFGTMFKDVSEAAKLGGGIEACAPQVHMLSIWCGQYMTPDERQVVAECRDGTSEQLQQILSVCMAVAQRRGAHEYKSEEPEVYEDPPAVPPTQDPSPLDKVAST